MTIIITGIIACEIGFWVALGLGLLARYVWAQRRLSTILLLVMPVLDVALLGLLTWDLLARGATAEFSHGLGAVYLGFTIAFGRQIIRRADAWFAFRFGGGPEPVKVPKAGIVRVKYEWAQWLRLLAGAVISGVILGAIIILAEDPARTGELLAWFWRIGLATGIWLLGWPVWETARFFVHAGTSEL